MLKASEAGVKQKEKVFIKNNVAAEHRGSCF
jgi:hypothetical protein